MKKLLIAFLFVVFCWCPLAFSGEKIVGNTPSGDPELDRSLEDLSDGAKENIGEFAKKMSSKYGISEETTDWLLRRVGMSPGDAYMTAKVSRISRRSVEDVANAYKENKGKGWGAIAKQMGIKPGSKEFHELKNDDSGMLGEYKEKAKKKKAKGKKNESSEENGQGKKEGFFERFFGGDKGKKGKGKK